MCRGGDVVIGHDVGVYVGDGVYTNVGCQCRASVFVVVMVAMLSPVLVCCVVGVGCDVVVEVGVVIDGVGFVSGGGVGVCMSVYVYYVVDGVMANSGNGSRYDSIGVSVGMTGVCV